MFQTVEFDRIVTNEMFEHMKNYEKLFEKVSKWLKPKSGILFIHVFCHRNFPYQFKVNSFLQIFSIVQKFSYLKKFKVKDSNNADWMARNFFTGGSMPSFDTFLFFQKHLAIKNTWMINGVHYSKVSTATYQGSPGNFREDQRTICPVVKPEFRHWKLGSIYSKRKKPKSRKFLQKLMVLIKSSLIWTIGNYSISCQAKHSDTTVEMIGVSHITLFNVTYNGNNHKLL